MKSLEERKQEFIQKAKDKFGDKFDYSKVEYVNNSTKVCVICPEHGEFMVAPTVFVNSKYGCSDCANIFVKNKELTNEQFIKKVIDRFGDVFDFSKTKYVNTNTKVCIICKIHGEFWVAPKGLFRMKFGCPKCAHEYSSEYNSFTFDYFVKKATNKYGNKFKFFKETYTNFSTKTKIECSIHGEF